MDTFEADAVVIGAGAVGLAAARALALKGREVLVLEAAGAIATETSSRNSEVIHAGLYYPTDSLKARLCVEGRRKLYQYCAAHGVEAHRCGKLVVAVDDGEAAALKLWRETGVRVLPGAYLARDVGGDNPGKGYIRVALVAPKDDMQRGLEKLRDCIYV